MLVVVKNSRVGQDILGQMYIAFEGERVAPIIREGIAALETVATITDPELRKSKAHSVVETKHK